jgi:hypothetical protein
LYGVPGLGFGFELALALCSFAFSLINCHFIFAFRKKKHQKKTRASSGTVMLYGVPGWEFKRCGRGVWSSVLSTGVFLFIDAY